ncbi:MAG: hypothetical protein AAF125_05065, partial [Chloroflexota bacterium]
TATGLTEMPAPQFHTSNQDHIFRIAAAGDVPNISPEQIMQLQRQHGNQFVQHLLNGTLHEQAITNPAASALLAPPVDRNLTTYTTLQRQDDPTGGSGKDGALVPDGDGKQAASTDPGDDWMDEYIKAVIDAALGKGDGFYVEGSLGITPAVPIHVNEGRLAYIKRVDEGTLEVEYHQKGQVNLDVGVGAGLSVSGKKKRGGSDGNDLGGEIGAQAQAGVKTRVIQKFRIPINQINDAMMSSMADRLYEMMMNPMGGAVSEISHAKAGQLIMESMKGQFDRFETDRKVEFSSFGQADAEAYLKFFDSKEGNKQIEARKYDRTGDRDKPFEKPKDWKKQFANYFLIPSFRAGALLQATVGYEDQPPVEDDQGNKHRKFKIFMEGEGAMSLPIVNLIPGLANLNGGVGVGIKVELIETPSGELQNPKVQVEVYLKSGDLDAYEGPASQTTLSFDVGKLANLSDFENLVSAKSGALDSIMSASKVADAFEGFEMRQRYNLGYTNRSFGAFVRRHTSTRMLLGDKLAKGGGIDAFLTVTYKIEAADFKKIMELAGPALMEGGKQAMNASDSGKDVGAGLGALQQYFTDFAESKEFVELEKAALDQTQVSEATLRLQGGIGAGLEGKVALLAKARLGGYLEGGIFCERDLSQDFGGIMSLRTFVDNIGKVYDNPVQYLPECKMIRELYEIVMGEDDGGALPEGETTKGNGPGDGGSGTGGEAETNSDGVKAVAVDPKHVDIDTSGMEKGKVGIYEAHKLSDESYTVDLVYEQDGVTYYVQGVPLRLVEEGERSVLLELDSDSPIQISPDDAKFTKYVSPGEQVRLSKSHF